MAVNALKNVSQCSTKNEDGVSEGEEEILSARVQVVKVCMKLSTKKVVRRRYPKMFLHLLTLFRDQMPEYENHRVTRVDVITAVDVISVDAQAEPC